MFEIDEPVRRAAVLSRLGSIESHAFLDIIGERTRGRPDPTRENTSAEGKASAVQFLRFPFTRDQITRFKTPGIQIVVGFDHPQLRSHGSAAGARARCAVGRFRLGSHGPARQAMADIAKEHEKHERLLAEKRRAFGDEHPETLTAMLDLADCLWTEGRLIAARKLEEQVVAGRRHRLGEKHFDTLKAIGKLAVTMAAQGDLAEARRLQERVLSGMRELYGDTGIETIRAMNNLAGTVSAQGDLDVACDLLETVVTTSCQEFGEQHPDSLTAMSNLAAVLWQRADREEAYALQRHVVDMRRRVNGAADQATRVAAEVLQMMERDSGF